MRGRVRSLGQGSGWIAIGMVARVVLVGFVVSAAAQPNPKKVAVAVLDFDYGMVASHWWGNYDIGKGIADQVADALIEDGTFHVVERKKVHAVLAEQDFSGSERADPSPAKLAKVGKVLGVKYVIVGSITKFGGEEKGYGAGGLGEGKIGGVGKKKAKTEVTLTARLIDTTTGEVLVSSMGDGISNKGGSFKVGGAGAGSGMGSSDYKASAIGDAQEMACSALVASIRSKMGGLGTGGGGDPCYGSQCKCPDGTCSQKCCSK